MSWFPGFQLYWPRMRGQHGQKNAGFPFFYLCLPCLQTLCLPQFFHLQYTVHFIFTSLFAFVQSPFLTAGQRGVSRGRRRLFFLLVISQALRFSCRLPAPCCASRMVFHLLRSLVFGPSLGKKTVCSGQKSFQTAKPPGQQKEKLLRSQRELCRACYNSEIHWLS